MRLRIDRVLSVTALFLFLIPGVAAGERIVDDFESYPEGTVIGRDPSSSPWRRFGDATNDHVYANSQPHRVINGSRSAIYGLTWPAGFGGIRRVLDYPTDISRFQVATVKIRSERKDTHTHVSLAVSNGPTTYVTTKTYPLSGKVQELTFELGQHELVRAAGDGTYEDIITNTSIIGLDFRNAEGSYYETVIFDDLMLLEDLPLQPNDEDTQASTVE